MKNEQKVYSKLDLDYYLHDMRIRIKQRKCKIFEFSKFLLYFDSMMSIVWCLRRVFMPIFSFAIFLCFLLHERISAMIYYIKNQLISILKFLQKVLEDNDANVS